MSTRYYKVDFSETNPTPSRIGIHSYYSRVYEDNRNLHVFEDGDIASVTWDNKDVLYVSGERLRNSHLKEIIEKYRYYYDISDQK